MKRLLIALVLMTSAFPAWAWNAAGHRLIAVIAWQQLSPPTRQTIAAILASHPDSHRWLLTAQESDAGLACFIEASTWPDVIRSDPRFFDERTEDATPLLAGFTEMARHRHWHYIDLPLDGGSPEGDGELDRQLLRLIQTLQGPPTRHFGQSEALAWIIHLVGDIHQPLHVGSNRDEGGNLYRLENPGNTRWPITNLHRWWDERPGPSRLRGKRLHQTASRLLTRQKNPPLQGTVALWRKETWQLAVKHAYPDGGIIRPEFSAQAQAITEQQIAAAGIRLGRLLEEIYRKVPRETQGE